MHVRSGLIASRFLLIENVEFQIGRTYVRCIYTTSEASKCIVYGGLYVLGETVFASWIENLTLHTSHSHTKIGLASSTLYAVRLYAEAADGTIGWSPSAEGYYIVETASATGGTGNGKIIATMM